METEDFVDLSIEEIERLMSNPIPLVESDPTSPQEPTWNIAESELFSLQADRKEMLRLKEIIEQKQIDHEHNRNMAAIHHEQQLELESLRNRRAFDGIAMADLETILASEDTEGIVITKKLSAIAWCHQQAVLIGSNMCISAQTPFGNTPDLKATAEYLYSVFFQKLTQNEKI